MDIWGISAVSMTGDVARMNSIANNIANSATPAFKREMTVARPFVEHLPSESGNGYATLPLEPRPWSDHRAGALKFTGNPLDLALDDANAFFELAGPNGPTYTRQGAFRVDSRGRLVTEAGVPVMGISGEISITTAKPVIDAAGRVLDGDRLLGQLRIIHADPAKLERFGAGAFGPGQSTAARQEAFDRVRQGYLEMSNVNVMAEMVLMMETVRHFEFNQRILQGYDGMLERTIRTLGEF